MLTMALESILDFQSFLTFLTYEAATLIMVYKHDPIHTHDAPRLALFVFLR